MSDVAIAIGLALNFVGLVGLLWKHGQWTGHVTTLLKEHQRDIIQHDRRINDIEIDVANLRGQVLP